MCKSPSVELGGSSSSHSEVSAVASSQVDRSMGWKARKQSEQQGKELCVTQHVNEERNDRITAACYTDSSGWKQR